MKMNANVGFFDKPYERYFHHHNSIIQTKPKFEIYSYLTVSFFNGFRFTDGI